MELATIDPHSQKARTEIHKISKFCVNRASLDWDTGIQKRKKFTKKCMEIARVSKKLSQKAESVQILGIGRVSWKKADMS